MIERRMHPLITPARLLKLAIVYLRQSSAPQVRDNWGSTDVQRQQDQLARQFGWSDHLIRTIDEDLGRTATTTKHRSGWHEILRLITSGSVGAVFVWTVSRLNRQLRDFEELRILAKLYGVVLVIDGRPADPGDPQDTVLLQVQALLAQHENSQQAAVMKEARAAKARKGTSCQGSPSAGSSGRMALMTSIPRSRPLSTRWSRYFGRKRRFLQLCVNLCAGVESCRPVPAPVARSSGIPRPPCQCGGS